MGLPEKPERVIVPVLMTSDTQGSPYSVLGTGFFIDADGTFLSAAHVFKDNPLPKGRGYSVVLLPGLEVRPVVDVAFSSRFDMAVGRVEGASPTDFLAIADSNAPMNFDLLSVEFSRVITKLLPDGRLSVEISPSYHKGHAISYRTSHFSGLEGAEIVELSFPALKGASGAPVIVGERDRQGDVVGMILANVERHLLPAQIERIEGEAGEPIETRYYLLPHAYAITCRHLREFVESRRSHQ